jgi:hypothetical protein
MKIPWINELKFRLGAGVTGNSAIAPYATQGATVSLFYPFSTSNTAGAIPSAVLANISLGWEKTTQYNAGLDFQLFKSRISGTLDVYTSTTNDLLMQRNIPSVTGYTSTYQNIGATANKGVDFSLTTVNIKNKNFNWTTNLNVSWQKEHIVTLSNGKQDDINNNWFINNPIGVIYGYKPIGIWQKSDAAEYAKFNANGNAFYPGNVRVADLNGDNKIDPNNDRTIIGNTRPRWVLGLTNTISYKEFEFSIFLYGRLKYLYNFGGEGQAARSVQRNINYYSETNTNAEYQKPIFNAGGASQDNYYPALGYVDGSFIKVRNVSIGYNVNNDKISKLGFSNLKGYIQIQNLGMLYSKTKFIEMDVVGPTWNKGFTVGINASF